MEKQLGYAVTRDGLFYNREVTKGKGDDAETGIESIWLSPPFSITARSKDADDLWGKVLEWDDPDGNPITWILDGTLLGGDHARIWQGMYERGLEISPNKSARDLLYAYLVNERPEKRARAVSRLGWHVENGQSCFLLPDKVYGRAGDLEIIFRGSQAHNPYGVGGEVEDWIEAIGRNCVGNSRLVLAVSVCCASPLLHIIGEESGGIHFHGDSRFGKTTIGIAGVSFGGNPQTLMVRYRATSNGLEAICEERCDGLLFLDEMGQVDAKEAGEIAYMIANGKGKQRARSDASARTAKVWRIMFLSSGEITLADKMNEIGKKTRAGQEIRLLNIPANAGASMGIFENIHEADSPGAFAEQLCRAACETHGAPLRAYLQRVAEEYADDPERIKNALRESRNRFIEGHLPAGASGQVRSACGRFAVIAAAGELATEYGLTGWPQGEATRAAVTCFQAWLEQRGTAGDHDLEKGIQQVISYVERHGASRFEDLNSQGFTVHNRVGFRKCDNRPCEGWRYEYLVLPEAWSEELCKGYNAKTIADEMVRRNLLVPQSGRPTQVVACGSYGRRRVYRLRLEEPDDRPEEQRRQDMIDKMMSDETCGTGLLNGHATNDNQPEATEQPVGQPVLN